MSLDLSQKTLIGSLLLGWSALAMAADLGPSPAQMLARYEHAAEMQQSASRRWILNEAVTPHWIPGRDEFWYDRQTVHGHSFVMVDAATGAKSTAFDQVLLARELGQTLGIQVDPNDLPIKVLWLNRAEHAVEFSAFGKNWLFLAGNGLREEQTPYYEYAVSPNGTMGVFYRDHNLWVKDFRTGSQRQLTTDGETHYSYGVDAETRFHPDLAPKVIWSPNSKYIFTAQTDDRQVLDAPVCDYAPEGKLRPQVVHYRNSYPGDLHVPTFRLTVIDVTNGRETPVRYENIPVVRMDDSPMDSNRMWWNEDSKTAYFVDIERGEKAVHVEEVNAETGGTRQLFSETSDTRVDLGWNVYTPEEIRPLAKSNQLIWYSERSGLAQLYLYDLKSGELVRQLTRGQWMVRDILNVDERHRQVFVSIAGREKNPYYQDIARIDLDTGAIKLLSASDADHEVLAPGDVNINTVSYVRGGGNLDGFQGVAPSGDYFVETVTRADAPDRTVLRDRNGNLVATIENANASRLPVWWHWPTPVTLTAADGKTKIYGLVFRPSYYDRSRKYPVVDYIYGGPQTSYVPNGFDQIDYLDAASIAELGFVTVMIDGRGTAERDRAFERASYGKLESASDLNDHIAGIRELAARDTSIDLSRVGIIGFSAGGYMAADAMLRFPDFFKVGVSISGEQDSRVFWNTWGERYEGYPVGSYYKQQANVTYAKNLKGKLLIAHGLVDVAVNPANMFQLEQALIDANRNFDILIFPQAGHNLPSYGQRRGWDYLVENLGGETPPHEFHLETDEDIESRTDEALSAAVQLVDSKKRGMPK